MCPRFFFYISDTRERPLLLRVAIWYWSCDSPAYFHPGKGNLFLKKNVHHIWLHLSRCPLESIARFTSSTLPAWGPNAILTWLSVWTCMSRRAAAGALVTAVIVSVTSSRTLPVRSAPNRKDKSSRDNNLARDISSSLCPHLSTSLITNTELVADSDPCNFETPPKKPNSRPPHAPGQTSAFPQEQTQNNCEVAATITTFRKMHMRHEISYRGIQFLVPESLCSPSYEGSKFTCPTARFRKNVNMEYHDLGKVKIWN